MDITAGYLGLDPWPIRGSPRTQLTSFGDEWPFGEISGRVSKCFPRGLMTQLGGHEESTRIIRRTPGDGNLGTLNSDFGGPMFAGSSVPLETEESWGLSSSEIIHEKHEELFG